MLCSNRMQANVKKIPVNISEVTKIVSIQGRIQVFVAVPKESYWSILYVLSVGRFRVHLFAGCGPDKEREGRAFDMVVQMAALMHDKHTAGIFL